MSPDPWELFREAMDSAGLRTADKLTPNGTLQRFRVDGDKPGSKNGWYVFHEDAPASGAYGSYKLGINSTWTVEKPERMNDEQRAILKARMERQRAERAAETAKAHGLAQVAAKAILAACGPADADHPYLVRKGIVGTDVRQLMKDVRYEVADDERPKRIAKAGVLVIPIRGPDGVVHGVQTIGTDGTKHFIKGTNKTGHYHAISGELTSTIVICEGFSTAATAFKATGKTTVIAFDSGNLKPVAKAIGAKYPEHQIIIGADNDRLTMKPVPNPGMHYACEAAAVVDGLVAWPEFERTDALSGGGLPTDFNDLAEVKNLEAVAASFIAAQRPEDIANHTDPRRHVERDEPAPAVQDAASSEEVQAPVIGRSRIPEAQPLVWSERFITDMFGHADHPTLVRYRGEWLNWREGAWTAIGDDEVRSAAYRWADERVMVQSEKTGLPEPFKPDRKKINDLLDALKGTASLPGYIEMPGLLDVLDIDPERAMPVKNGILELRNRRLLPASPRLFIASGSPVEYLPEAPTPEVWMRFLSQIWPDDPDAIALLQEWVGLCLTSYTGLQKALLIVGPKRSGKGTISRVLEGLVGKGAVVAPTLSSLATPFGLAPLIGKRVALVGDARLSGRSDLAQITERLLGITGEDSQSIDRKHREVWTGKLTTRFAIFANEAPMLKDASGALAGRLVTLTMRRSFFGEEDLKLFDNLQPELPGILNWAMTGLARLAKRGHFVQPSSSSEMADSFSRASSPVSEFAEDECIVDPAASVACTDLYYAWQKWCEARGLKSGSSPNLSRDLATLIPDLRTGRPRGDADRLRAYIGIGLR